MAVKTTDCGTNTAKQFYRAVRKHCPCAYRKKLSSTLKAALCDFTDANPSADMAALTAHFGRPEDFADEFINEMTADEKQTMLRRSKIVKWCVLTATAVFIAAVVISAIIIVKQSKESDAYYYYYELTDSEGEDV